MEPERWEQIECLYHSVLEREESGRGAFLKQACAGDEVLRREVQLLLSQGEKTDSFLEAPAPDVAARAFADDQLRGPERASQPDVMAGRTISHYLILEKLGGGEWGWSIRLKIPAWGAR